MESGTRRNKKNILQRIVAACSSRTDLLSAHWHIKLKYARKTIEIWGSTLSARHINWNYSLRLKLTVSLCQFFDHTKYHSHPISNSWLSNHWVNVVKCSLKIWSLHLWIIHGQQLCYYSILSILKRLICYFSRLCRVYRSVLDQFQLLVSHFIHFTLWYCSYSVIIVVDSISIKLLE